MNSSPLGKTVWGTLIPLSQGCSQRGSSPQTRRGYLHPDFGWAASTDTWALQIQPSNPRGSLPHVYFKHSSILIKQHRKVNFRYGTSKIIIALKQAIRKSWLLRNHLLAFRSPVFQIWCVLYTSQLTWAYACHHVWLGLTAELAPRCYS